MRFYLIRHGDPEYATDSLTQHGRMQAEAIATYLTAYHGLGTKRHKVGVVSSPMGRARETAAPTARALVNGVAEVENWLEEKNWRVPAVNLWKGDEGHEARQHKVDKEVDMDGAEEDAGVAEVARKKKGTMAVWDVPAKILRDPVTSEDDQWSVHFHNSLEQETLPNSSFDAFRPAMEAMRGASDDFMRRRVGLRRTGRTTYCIADEDAFDPNLQLVIFAHNGSLLAWLSILLGIPLAMMMTSFYLQPSSITTVVFEERSEGHFAPRCLGVGESSHMAFNDPPLNTVMSRYERVMPHAPHWPRPSGIKANFW